MGLAYQSVKEFFTLKRLLSKPSHHSAIGDIELERHWLRELFSKPGNGILLNLLEVISYAASRSMYN